MYPRWFYVPGVLLFVVIFIVPTAAAFYFSLTRWTLFNATFIGFDNFSDNRRLSLPSNMELRPPVVHNIRHRRIWTHV